MDPFADWSWRVCRGKKRGVSCYEQWLINHNQKSKKTGSEVPVIVIIAL
jgi:hypothetical protein